jgi:hypothetical protein
MTIDGESPRANRHSVLQNALLIIYEGVPDLSEIEMAMRKTLMPNGDILKQCATVEVGPKPDWMSPALWASPHFDLYSRLGMCRTGADVAFSAFLAGHRLSPVSTSPSATVFKQYPHVAD